MGTCTYLLSGTCNSTQLQEFEILIKSEFRGTPGPSYPKIIQVNIGKRSITIKKGLVLEVIPSLYMFDKDCFLVCEPFRVIIEYVLQTKMIKQDTELFDNEHKSVMVYYLTFFKSHT